MTEYLYTYKRPRRMKCHQTMVKLDRGLKEAYRSGRLVEPIKGRKKRPKAILKPCPKCRSTNLGKYEIKAGYGEIVCEDCGFTYPRDACFGVDMMTPEELIIGWNGLANRKGKEDGSIRQKQSVESD